MDFIDDCRIDCEFISSENKRKLLEQRILIIKELLRNNLVDEEKICDALNFVCNNIDKYSCLQCYINGDYDTGNCATSCIGKFRKSFCFDLNSVIKIIVIAEEYGGKVIIVTFFPVTRNKDFERKCGNRFLHI